MKNLLCLCSPCCCRKHTVSLNLANASSRRCSNGVTITTSHASIYKICQLLITGSTSSVDNCKIQNILSIYAPSTWVKLSQPDVPLCFLFPEPYASAWFPFGCTILRSRTLSSRHWHLRGIRTFLHCSWCGRVYRGHITSLNSGKRFFELTPSLRKDEGSY